MADLKETLLDDKSTHNDGELGGKSTAYKLLSAAAMLASGTFTTIFAKAMFESSATGSETCNMQDDDDFHCQFNKPWFSVLLMKVSMTGCLLLYYGLGIGKENPEADNPSWKTIKWWRCLLFWIC